MLHIPILRMGEPYESIDKVEIVHHASANAALPSGDPVALVSQANSGMLSRDIHRMDDTILEQFSVVELVEMCKKAAELFTSATLPLGDDSQSFDDYVGQLSATTGMPVAYCRNNATKIQRAMSEVDVILRGLTRGFDLSILDRGHGDHNGGHLSFSRVGRIFGAVLPSNSPGVHSLWVPAVVLKAPIVLKPGREEPWSPFRMIESFCAAGMPREAFGFYPTDHAGAGELLRCVDRAMLFGGGATTRPWVDDPRVEIHGPGYSKVLLGDDCADDWEQYVDLMVSSISANGGRSCINASGIWTPRHGRKIAEAVARRLAEVKALPADDPDATLAAFANPAVAEAISAAIDHGLRSEGAVDLTQELRGSPRRATIGRCSYLLPTLIHCADRDHVLANREFLFPYASVVECDCADMPNAIGPSLIVSAITHDDSLTDSLMASPNVDRLNIGPIPTWRISWDQPHEGNLFEHLYRQRAFQVAGTDKSVCGSAA